MIGTGLSATPTASDRICPIASPRAAVSLRTAGAARRQARIVPGRVSAQITQMSSAITRIDQNG
jgi:hypothetical protein